MRVRQVLTATIGFAAFAAASLAAVAADQPYRASELAEQYALLEDAEVMFNQKDFAGLDRVSESYRATNARTSSGYWKLVCFYANFDRINHDGPSTYPNGHPWAAIEAWRSAQPRSPTLAIAEALLLINDAKRLKAPDYARSPLPGWQPDRDILALARKRLDDAKDYAERDPHWYIARARIDRLERVPLDELLVNHLEALERHPFYDQLHLEMLQHLLQTRSLTPDRIETFVSTIARASEADTGWSMYARLYERAYPWFRPDQTAGLNGFDWVKLDAGFKRISRDYPTPWNRDHHAFYACIAGDRPTTRALIAAAAGDVVREAWKSSPIYERCRSFAGQ